MDIKWRGVLAIFFFAVCCLVPGCAATKKIKDDIVGGEGNLKKKIAFFDGTNKYGQGGEKLGDMAMIRLKNDVPLHCQDLVVLDSEETRQGLNSIPLLSPGYRDSLVLAQIGRVLGLNAVFETTLHDIVFTWEKRGIWGFRDEVPLMKVMLGVKLYDVETTATLMNEVFQEEMVLSEMNLTEENMATEADMTRYSKELIETALSRIAPKVGDDACKRLAEISWKGFIIGKDGDQYLLSAGQDVGLKQGDVVDVFKMEDPIKGVDGDFFLIPGPKIGELQIAEVRSNTALATVVSGQEDFEKSCSVALKTR